MRAGRLAWDCRRTAREGLMELTGNWDGRISRRTLLRTGGTLAAGLVLFDRAALRADAALFGHPVPPGSRLWGSHAQQRGAVDAARAGELDGTG